MWTLVFLFSNVYTHSRDIQVFVLSKLKIDDVKGSLSEI